MEGFRHNVGQICELFHNKCINYNAGNEAIGLKDQSTDGDICNRSLVNVVGAKVDTVVGTKVNKEGKYKFYKKVYQLPNYPGSRKQVCALPMVWQGTNFHQPP